MYIYIYVFCSRYIYPVWKLTKRNFFLGTSWHHITDIYIYLHICESCIYYYNNIYNGCEKLFLLFTFPDMIGRVDIVNNFSFLDMYVITPYIYHRNESHFLLDTPYYIEIRIYADMHTYTSHIHMHMYT